MTILTRRRFIAVSAAAALAPQSLVAAPVATWRGIAMGAGAQMQIAGMDQAAAQVIFARVQAEIDRLENIFSLYRPNSALCQLNARGHLDLPPLEMLELFSLTSAIHRATEGAFDPSVQGLWLAYQHAASAAQPITGDALAEARSRVGWDQVQFDPQAVRFGISGMSLTFNGIAQGYLADRVAHILRQQGLENVLVDMGEIVALGQRTGGGGWRTGIVAPDRTEPVAVTDLSNRALATSAPMGTTLGPAKTSHILDPRTGAASGLWDIISVSADRAAVADGLSTAFTLLDIQQIASALRVFPDAHIEYLGGESQI